MIFSKKTNLIFIAILLSAVCYLLSSAVVFAETVSLPNPINPTTGEAVSIADIFARVIKAFLGLVGIISFVFLMVGGFIWLTSAGNPEKIKKGMSTVLWAVLGLVVVFLSYTIVHFVMKTLMTPALMTP